MMKTTAILITLLLVIAVAPAYATEDGTAAARLPTDGIVATSAIPITGVTADDIRKEVRDKEPAEALEKCVKRLQDAFPVKARDTVKAKEACRRILATGLVDGREPTEDKVDAIETTAVDGNKIRVMLKQRYKSLNNNQIERLSRVKDERRLKIEELDEELILKLSKLSPEQLRKLADLKEERLIKIASLDVAQIERLANLPRSDLKEFSELDESEIKTRLGHRVRIEKKAEDIGKSREVAKERLEIAKKNYEIARERYQKAEEKYKERKEKFKEAKLRIREICEADETSAECEEARAEAFDRAKEFLLNHADAMIAQLEEMKSQVEANEGMDEARAAELITKLDEKIALLTELRADIEAAETKDKLKEHGRNLANAWKHMKLAAVDHRLDVIESNAGRIIKHSQAMEAALEKVLQRLEEAGYDVTEVDSQVDEFSALINEAMENWKLGREKFAEFRATDNPSENKELLDKAKEYFETAHSKAKEANRKLKEIRKILNDLTGEDDGFENEPVEIEVEKETDLPPPPPTIDDDLEEFEDKMEDDEHGMMDDDDDMMDDEGLTAVDMPENIQIMADELSAMIDSDVTLEYEVVKESSELELKEETEGVLTDKEQAKWDKIKTAMEEYLQGLDNNLVYLEIEVEEAE